MASSRSNAPNTACSRLVGFAAIYEHCLRSKGILLSEFCLVPPPAANASRWALSVKITAWLVRESFQPLSGVLVGGDSFAAAMSA